MKTTRRSKPACPASGCGYNENMRVYDAALAKPLVLKSTRSHANEDAHRDMDGFDADKELARLRRAVEELRPILRRQSRGAKDASEAHREWQSLDQFDTGDLHVANALLFVVHAIDNIDEYIRREGLPPAAWRTPAKRKANRQQKKVAR